MQVFISWSGEQSNAVAVALREWLPKVLASRITPFVSSEDIDKGSRGLAKIAAELEGSNFGVVVVTPSNVESTWINFEAGSLGKAVGDSRVAPLLVGLADADLDGPLKQFQNTAANDREAVRKLVLSINRAHPEPFDAGAVSTLFDAHWEELEIAIKEALALQVAGPEVKRSKEDILDEVLTTVRALQRDIAKLKSDPDRRGLQPVEPETLARALRNALAHDQMWRPNETPGKTLGTQDILAMILSSQGVYYTIGRDGSGLEVELGKDTARPSAGVLRDIQGLARNSSTVITLVQADGSGFRFDEQGNEYRRGSDDEEFTRRAVSPDSGTDEPA